METMEKVIKEYLINFKEKHPEANWFLDCKNDDNINACVGFIKKTVQEQCKTNFACATDDYVFGLAVHFFDETKTSQLNATDKESYVLTEEDKAKALEIAKKELEEEYNKSAEERAKEKAINEYKEQEKKKLREQKKAEQESQKMKDKGYEQVSLF